MLKIRLMGTKKDIKWFRDFLRKSPQIEVEEFSEVFPNKGTNRFYRAYAEVKRNSVTEK